MPTVSIITISYNNLGGLTRTMKSVFEQDFTDFEYIIIDGGSSDKSKDLIESFEDRITYWVSEPDRGVYHAMNKGILQSKGEYLHFLNAGDIYASKDVLSRTFSKPQTIPLLRGSQICDYSTKTVRWSNLGDREITLYDLYTNTLLHQATFIKSNLFEKYGLYDENLKIVSDWKFFLQSILGGEKTFYLGFDIVIFEMNGISTNLNHGEQHLKERQQVLSDLVPNYLRTDYERLKTLEKNSYISDFVIKHKIVFFLFRIANKLHKIISR